MSTSLALTGGRSPMTCHDFLAELRGPTRQTVGSGTNNPQNERPTEQQASPTRVGMRRPQEDPPDNVQ